MLAVIIQVIMLLAGLVIIVRGRIRLPGRLVIDGWRAQAIGFCLMLPMPLRTLLALAFSALINAGKIGYEAISIAKNAETGLILGGLVGAAIFATLPERLSTPDESGKDG